MKNKTDRTLLVIADKTFRITVPSDAKLTFGPWSPLKKGDTSAYAENNVRGGTLRVYDADKNVIAVFSGVNSYRDTSLSYSEQVVKEEGATIWKSDQDGYTRETKNNARKEWIEPKLIGAGRKKNEVF